MGNFLNHFFWKIGQILGKKFEKFGVFLGGVFCQPKSGLKRHRGVIGGLKKKFCKNGYLGWRTFFWKKLKGLKMS